MLDNGSGALAPQKEKMEGANATLKCHLRDFNETVWLNRNQISELYGYVINAEKITNLRWMRWHF